MQYYFTIVCKIKQFFLIAIKISFILNCIRFIFPLKPLIPKQLNISSEIIGTIMTNGIEKWSPL